jgi:phage terminase large subunit
MNVEVQVKLNKFKPRSYQIPIIDAIENKGYKRVLAILPRRAGKDVVGFNIAIRYLIKNIAVIYYIFPTYSQGRKILWDSVLNDGTKFIDFIPKELIEGINSHEMKIRFKNGSLLQVVGSDNYDSLVGTNPKGIIFSEYALQDERAYTYLRPILTANNGFALFLSTPRGKNHLWSMYNVAKESPDWFCYFKTINDTQHIPLFEIEKERADGLMSEDMILQEYYCDFSLGVEGSYYAKYIDNMKLKGQIGSVAWEPGFKVHTAWDIGVRDSTVIIFYQVIGQTVRIIDCYEKTKEGIEHYVKILESKPYSYGKHFAPHDIRVREFGSGITRWEKARQLGITFSMADNIPIPDGIEAVRSMLPKTWIDQNNCAPLIKALENYRQEFDSKRKIYKSQPLHDQFSHMADAMRYLAVSLPKTRDGLSPEDLERRYQEAMGGNRNYNMPNIFREDLPPY